MLKHLQIDSQTGRARLVITLSKENLERLAKEPIAFSPRRDLVPFFLEHEGLPVELELVALLAGDTNESIRHGARLPRLPFELRDRVRIPSGETGTVLAVFGSEEEGWKLTVELDGGGGDVDIEASAAERVQ